MKKWIAAGVWAALYLICFFLGRVPEPADFGAVLCTVMAVLFFIPGGLLLYWGHTEKDRQLLKAIRLTAALSLGLTMATLVGTFLSVGQSALLGTVLHWVLSIVSVPMLCSRYWVLSLFLWACLLIGSFLKKKN